MLEHEAKILGVNKPELQSKLEALGARKVLDDITYIEGYDFGGSGLDIETAEIPERFEQIFSHINALRGSFDMFSKGAYLRLRREGEKNELIFKQKVKGAKGVKSEIEISVPIEKAKWDSVVNLLNRCGLQRIVVQEKKRISYVYPPFRYDIDTWPGVPTYLEVEAPTPEGVLEAIALLGLTQENARSISAAEVFIMYRIKNPRHMVFGEKK